MTKKIYILSFISIIFFSTSYSQQISGGKPLSTFFRNIDIPVQHILNIPDSVTSKVRNNDANKNLPPKVGIVIPTEIDIIKKGTWNTLPDGEKICRLQLISDNAEALGLRFSDFTIYGDGKLFIYNEDYTELIGAFTKQNNDKQLLTDYIYGNSVYIEYNHPANSSETPILKLSGVSNFFKGFNDKVSGTCQVNIACSEGNNFRDQIRGVVKLITKGGSSFYLCSGTLMNNTSEDRTPYILTANHCDESTSDLDMNEWKFIFNYQYTNCAGTEIDKNIITLTGAEKIASSINLPNNIGSDFLLLKLYTKIPEATNAYFCGWDRNEIATQTGVCIHHPAGDYKKISTYTSSPIMSSYGGIPWAFWNVKWSKTVSGNGTTEGGSSGSGLFNNSGLLIGTLTGGESSCLKLNESDFFGMFSKSWNSNGTDIRSQLAPWLDPLNTNTKTLRGLENKIGVKELNNQITINAIPNPATNYVNLSIPENKTIYVLTLIDINGRQFNIDYETNGNNTITISVKNVAKGICFAKIIFTDGTFSTVKIIKQ